MKRIRELWQYLKIQDESLAIRVYNSNTSQDEYILVKCIDNELVTSRVNIDELDMSSPIRIISQRGDDGRFEIPDVSQIETDKLNDY